MRPDDIGNKIALETMDHLPEKDIPMLVSSINYLLRNEEFDDLDQICFCYNVDRGELEKKLSSCGYEYNNTQNRII